MKVSLVSLSTLNDGLLTGVKPASACFLTTDRKESNGMASVTTEVGRYASRLAGALMKVVNQPFRRATNKACYRSYQASLLSRWFP